MKSNFTDAGTALLVMDFQNLIVGMLEDSTELIRNTAAAIESARQRGIPVIYVVVQFRNGYPEVSANNKSFSALTSLTQGSSDAGIMEAVAPGESDIVVTKRRVSAFSGSDLEVVLRSQRIDRLVLCGIATSGVVLSTLREAADKDFRLTVLSDCCADRDEEVHRVLLTKVFPRQAEVVTCAEWVTSTEP